MKKILVLMMVLVNLSFAVATIARGEEELFDTKTASALFDQGMENLRGKNLDKAIDAFEESVSVAPEARAYYFLGYAYYLKGKEGDSESRKKSIENFEKAFELDPVFTPNKNKPGEQPPSGQEKKSEQQPSSAAPSKPLLETSQPGDTFAKQQKP